MLTVARGFGDARRSSSQRRVMYGDDTRSRVEGDAGCRLLIPPADARGGFIERLKRGVDLLQQSLNFVPLVRPRSGLQSLYQLQSLRQELSHHGHRAPPIGAASLLREVFCVKSVGAVWTTPCTDRVLCITTNNSERCSMKSAITGCGHMRTVARVSVSDRQGISAPGRRDRYPSDRTPYSAACLTCRSLTVRIVTSSSAAEGCSAIVASKSALVAFIFTAIATA